MERGHLLILTALYYEARPIARELGLRFTSRTEADGHPPDAGHVLLRIIGPRARHLPTHPPAGGCRGVIMAGLGGGLAPELKRGDIVIDQQSHNGPATSLRRGQIATVERLAATPQEKDELYRRTNALVVDMENAAARAWAAAQGVPFVGIRAVSDTAAEALDPATLRIVDEEGRVSSRRLAGELLRRPALVTALWRLRSSGHVADILAREVANLVAARWPSSPVSS